jgi:hypothetical protein
MKYQISIKLIFFYTLGLNLNESGNQITKEGRHEFVNEPEMEPEPEPEPEPELVNNINEQRRQVEPTQTT